MGWVNSYKFVSRGELGVFFLISEVFEAGWNVSFSASCMVYYGGVVIGEEYRFFVYFG